MAAGVVQIPWYATLFRGDQFADALEEIAPVAMRYGATEYRVYRNRDDMYKFIQMSRSRTSRTSRPTGTERSSASGAPSTPAGTRCRSSTPGRPDSLRRR